MTTIACNSAKGGTGKTTLSIIFLNALAKAGYRCLAMDTDMINHSLSFYFNSGIPYETIVEKNIFKVFTGSPLKDTVLPITDTIDLVHADIRLSDFRSIETFKRLKDAMKDIDYDYVIIDTAPTFDNIIINVLMASDILLIPVQQDIFNYQSLKYLLKKLSGLDLPSLDVHIIMNQYEKPRTDNKTAYSNQLIDLFTEDKAIVDFINPAYISKSTSIKKYINDQHYHINSRSETKKQYEELSRLIYSITQVAVEGNW